MVDIESLREVVVTGLKEYLGCPVIKSNQNAPAPDYPYCSYTITTVASENNGTYGEYEDGVSRKGVNTVWSITVQSDDNSESVTLANKAREWLDYVGTVYLNDNGVIVQAVTSITNRDNILTSEYEYRNGFDCFFWCYDTVEISVDTIDTVQIDNSEITQEDYEDIIAELNKKLDEANADFENIRNAIAEKGIDIDETTPTSLYAAKIGEITGGITDTELSETSTNPVQNKVITAKLKEKQDKLTSGNGVSISDNVISANESEIDHSKLKNLDAENQHPIKSIKGLTTELNEKLEEIPTLSNLDIENIINSFV